MLNLSVRVDTRQALKVLEQAKKQVIYAGRLALNDVAKNIKDGEQTGILATFRNPRPFTVNSVSLIPATKANPLSATIFIKNKTAAYLDAYEHGGAHHLPNRPELGRVILEPVHMPVDAYGQIRKAQLAAILARPDVFIGVVHGIMGIWMRPPRGERCDGTRGTKGKLRLAESGQGRTGLILLAKVIPNQPVSKHLNFDVRGMALFLEQYPAAFHTAFARALATAK